MCGIAGMCNFYSDYLSSEEKKHETLSILKNMRLSIAHRGNDQAGEYLRNNVGLSHTRLAIRDISKGIQPMVRHKDNCEYAIVFNGEIYNTAELTQELEEAGYSFETTCDTEVILYSYMQYGSDCVKKLNGIFAFAIWDGAQEQLVLVRDRVGIKPLFYTVKNQTLIFGSEIKSLFAHPDVEPSVSLDSFREIFGIGPARTPGCGVFDGISEIEPGCYAVFSQSGIKYVKYWDIISREHTDSYEKTVETVSYLLRDAVTRQMISDVPVCSFLSGGIDSSIVTAIAARIMNDAGTQLNTYSFDFTGNDKYFAPNSFQPERDQPYIDIMLKHINVNHHNLLCDENHLVSLLNESMKSKDLPGMADVDASLMYFCGLVSKKNKVVLTGECADELVHT